MRPGGLVAFSFLLFACKDAEKKADPPAPKDPPPAAVDAAVAAPTPPAGDPVFAKALAARTTPLLEIPPQKTSKVGRCSVRIEPRSLDDSAMILAEFRGRNGVEWTDLMSQIPSLDEWNGYVIRQRREVAKEVTEVEVDAASATAVAAEFLAKNHELLGLDAGDVAVSKVDAVEEPSARMKRWEVRIVGERPRPGFERFERVNRAWRVSVSVDRDGRAAWLDAQTFTLPDFETCTDFTITPDDARKAIIGHEPSFSDVSGQPRSGGKVAAADIKSVDQAMHVIGNADRSMTVVLAYRLELESGMWTYLVDAETGEILLVLQNFST